MLLEKHAIAAIAALLLSANCVMAQPTGMDAQTEKTIKKTYKAKSVEPISLENDGSVSAYLVHTKQGVGMVSPTGAPMLDCVYSSISVFPDQPRKFGAYTLPASSATKYYLLEDNTSALGLATADGTILLPTQYTDIALLPAVDEGLTEYVKDGKKYWYYHPAAKSSFLAKLRTSQIIETTQPDIHVIAMDGTVKATLTEFYYLPGLIFGSTGTTFYYDKLTPSTNVYLCGDGNTEVMPDGIFNKWPIMRWWSSKGQSGLLLSDGTPLLPLDNQVVGVYMAPDHDKAKANTAQRYIVAGENLTALMLKDWYGNNASDGKFVEIAYDGSRLVAKRNHTAPTEYLDPADTNVKQQFADEGERYYTEQRYEECARYYTDRVNAGDEVSGRARYFIGSSLVCIGSDKLYSLNSDIRIIEEDYISAGKPYTKYPEAVDIDAAWAEIIQGMTILTDFMNAPEIAQSTDPSMSLLRSYAESLINHASGETTDVYLSIPKRLKKVHSYVEKSITQRERQRQQEQAEQERLRQQQLALMFNSLNRIMTVLTTSGSSTHQSTSGGGYAASAAPSAGGGGGVSASSSTSDNAIDRKHQEARLRTLQQQRENFVRQLERVEREIANSDHPSGSAISLKQNCQRHIQDIDNEISQIQHSF